MKIKKVKRSKKKERKNKKAGDKNMREKARKKKFTRDFFFGFSPASMQNVKTVIDTIVTLTFNVLDFK
jgi:hypothetical protein